ncbi:MAG: hypothetical protein QOI51_2330 [Nocardioidaceae bacterium]|jgi:hypothetical protein|nr:hypothetical protein [Nocardioidaceae bacterium]
MTATSGHDLVAALKDQHDRVEQMMAVVLSTHGEDRRAVFTQVRRFLAAHEAAEEVFIHASGGRLLEDSEVSEERVTEEAAAAEVISALEEIEVDSGAFEKDFEDLRQSVSAHARAEERQELPPIIGVSGPDDLERMCQGLGQVDLMVARHSGPLGDGSLSFETMLEAAKEELRILRGDAGG